MSHHTRLCTKLSAELLTVIQVPAADGAGATKPAGRRARSVLRAPAAPLSATARLGRAPLALQARLGALWLSNPATALPLPHPRRRPRPAHARHQPLARGHGAALPDPTQVTLGGQSQKNCQLPEECASPVQVAD